MAAMNEHICPVCGYNLGFAAWAYDSPSDAICPSCGIQFGYDDAAGGNMNNRKNIYNNWRKEWVNQGMPWSSAGVKRPHNWDPIRQLKVLQ